MICITHSDLKKLAQSNVFKIIFFNSPRENNLRLLSMKACACAGAARTSRTICIRLLANYRGCLSLEENLTVVEVLDNSSFAFEAKA